MSIVDSSCVIDFCLFIKVRDGRRRRTDNNLQRRGHRMKCETLMNQMNLELKNKRIAGEMAEYETLHLTRVCFCFLSFLSFNLLFFSSLFFSRLIRH